MINNKNNNNNNDNNNNNNDNNNNYDERGLRNGLMFFWGSQFPLHGEQRGGSNRRLVTPLAGSGWLPGDSPPPPPPLRVCCVFAFACSLSDNLQSLTP